MSARETAHRGHVTERPSTVPSMMAANLEAASKALAAARAKLAREELAAVERDELACTRRRHDSVDIVSV